MVIAIRKPCWNMSLLSLLNGLIIGLAMLAGPILILLVIDAK